MKNYIILLKFGEIVLKGANKGYFEKVLLRQIRRRVKKYGAFDVSISQSIIYVRAKNDDADMDAAYGECKKTFGIVMLSRAYATEKSVDAVDALARELAPELIGGGKTFKVEARRSDKAFPLTSPQICEEVGAVILETCPYVSVDVHNPEVIIRVEIREEFAFISGAPEHGAGGMPVGTNGKALLLLSGGIDSPVAGQMICRRGVKLEVIHFESFPYTSERALMKVRELAGILAVYNGDVGFHTVSVTEIQETLQRRCDEDYFTLLLRRFMMRIAERIANERECRALVTGESVGQVASQTMDALCVTDSVVNMPVFRPCIGMDKEEIILKSRAMNAFEVSIQPYEDCCTVFTPRHPKTRPTLENVLNEEARIDVDGLLERAMATHKVEWIV